MDRRISHWMFESRESHKKMAKGGFIKVWSAYRFQNRLLITRFYLDDIIHLITWNETRLRFVERWEHEISKNPVFIEEFEEEERYLRANDGPGKPCGRIYREFGLHGQYMELRDASVDTRNGIDDLGQTDFGNDHLMSMVPFEGKLAIRHQPSDSHCPSYFLTLFVLRDRFLKHRRIFDLWAFQSLLKVFKPVQFNSWAMNYRRHFKSFSS